MSGMICLGKGKDISSTSNTRGKEINIGQLV